MVCFNCGYPDKDPSVEHRITPDGTENLRLQDTIARSVKLCPKCYSNPEIVKLAKEIVNDCNKN